MLHEILIIGAWILAIILIMIVMAIALFFIAVWLETGQEQEDHDGEVDHELIRRIQEQIREEENQIFINP